MKKLFENLSLNLFKCKALDLDSILFLSFLIFTLHIFSQNLRDYNPRLYEMIKSGKDPKEIEKLYNPDPRSTIHETRSTIPESRLAKPDSADPYFDWEGHYGTVYCVAYNKDVTLLAGGNGTIMLRNIGNGILVNIF
jgi:hypothetical protein